MLLVIRRLDLAEKQEDARTCPKVRQACEKVGARRNQAPSPQRGGCRTFLDPRPDDRRGAEGASCLMYCRSSSRAICWPTRPGNGKQLDDLILEPNGKLVLLCPHLQQDCPPSEASDRWNTWSGPHQRSHLGPQGADTSSDPGWPARHRGPLVLEAMVMWGRSEKRHAEGHGSRPVASRGRS
jgi:hypothetical protein